MSAERGARKSRHGRGSTCDKAEFCAAKTFWPLRSACPEQSWYEDMVQVDPSPHKVIMSMGCNKGSDAIGMMIRWDASEETFSLKSWRLALVRQGLSRRDGGACGEVNKLHPQRQSAFRNGLSPIVYCVEAMPSTYEMLKNAALSLNYAGVYGGHSPSAFKVIHAVASNFSGGEVEIPIGRAGVENLGIGLEGRRPHAKVPATTVDTIVQKESITQLDILLIDTEGHDPAVLNGARNTLREK